MTPVLSYEVPTLSEARFLSRRTAGTLWGGVAVAAVFGLCLPVLLHGRHGWSVDPLGALGPTIAVVVLVLCLAVHGQTQVFADRLEVSLRGAGLTLWRRRVVWPELVDCTVSRRRRSIDGYKVWGRSPGRTLVMFGGDGVRITMRDGGELAIGSDDPARLAAAIDHARSAEPAAERPGAALH